MPRNRCARCGGWALLGRLVCKACRPAPPRRADIDRPERERRVELYRSMLEAGRRIFEEGEYRDDEG